MDNVNEINDICNSLRAKESLVLIGRLLDLKKENLTKAMLNSESPEKCWDLKNNVNFIESFKKEIISKSNKE